MADTDDVERTIQGYWREIAPLADTIADAPDATVRPARDMPSTGGQRAMEVLERLGADFGATEEGANGGKFGATPITIHGTLGEGGLGLVHLATQLSLGRHVAVKTLKPDVDDSDAKMRLLREGWVTGALEHPNVLPVYEMGLGSDGRPFIVLKRVEGSAWSALLRERDLAWNIGVLLQVCQAVRFAHSRGVIHRDLKPDNVMVGEFGEVYLLDWGIAVALEDDGTGRLALASKADAMAGTLGYMAPEMLGGQADRLGERTDVYLLGALLYETLSGEPPHRGSDVRRLVYSVVESRPELPSDAPEELAEAVLRAMASQPEERFPDVDAFEGALRSWLDHRSSVRLTEEAELRLVRLLGELDRWQQHSGHAHHRGHEERTELYNLFGAVRFGFRQALGEWPGNDKAQQGLMRAVEAMVECELDCGEPRAAAALLVDLEHPPDELRERVEEALGAREDERRRMAELERMGRDLDPMTGRRTRTFLALLMGLMWGLAPLVVQWTDGWQDHRSLAAWPAGLVVVVVALGVWARDSMTKTAVNRQILGLFILAPSIQLVLSLAAWLAGMPVEWALMAIVGTWLTLAAAAAATIHATVWSSAAAYAVVLLVMARWPSLRFYAMAAANFSLGLCAAWMWHREGKVSSPGTTGA